MNTTRVLQYMGITLLMGCSVGLVFTIIFMIILPLPLFEAFLGIFFFTPLSLLGLFIIRYDFKEPIETEEPL